MITCWVVKKKGIAFSLMCIDLREPELKREE